jgi:hypothetical protein
MDKKENETNAHDLVKKHIENKDHEVTNEELENIKVGEDAITDEELKNEADKIEDEMNHKPHLPNPYDVL